MDITATGFVRDEGTLVLLSGLAEDNREVVFAAERRCAFDILDAVEGGLEPVVEVPDYLIVSTTETVVPFDLDVPPPPAPSGPYSVWPQS